MLLMASETRSFWTFHPAPEIRAIVKVPFSNCMTARSFLSTADLSTPLTSLPRPSQIMRRPDWQGKLTMQCTIAQVMRNSSMLDEMPFLAAGRSTKDPQAASPTADAPPFGPQLLCLRSTTS